MNEEVQGDKSVLINDGTTFFSTGGYKAGNRTMYVSLKFNDKPGPPLPMPVDRQGQYDHCLIRINSTTLMMIGKEI